MLGAFRQGGAFGDMGWRCWQEAAAVSGYREGEVTSQGLLAFTKEKQHEMRHGEVSMGTGDAKGT